MLQESHPTFSKKIISPQEQNLLTQNILRCQKKCLCYQQIVNKHCYITDYETDLINKNIISNDKTKLCFYNYNGKRQFKIYNE